MAAFLLTILAVGLTLVAANPLRQERVIGGFETTIQAHPYSVAVLFSWDFVNFQQQCGGTIINNRAVLTAARCVIGYVPIRFRLRVGSTYANSGGVVSSINSVIIHPEYRAITLDNNIGIVHSATSFVFSSTVQPTNIAGANYNLGNNATVTAIGWGAISDQGPRSEILREVKFLTVNPIVCRIRYASLGRIVTNNMLCAGWLNVGGRGQCAGDEGSPLIHNNVTVGIHSWGQGCGLARYPAVSTRVSRVSDWISSNKFSSKKFV